MADDQEALIQHGLKALRESLVQDRELTIENTSVSVVGAVKKDGKKVFEPFQVYDGQDVKAWIDSVAEEKEGGGDDMEVEE